MFVAAGIPLLALAGSHLRCVGRDLAPIASDSSTATTVPAGTLHVPYIAGDFERVFTPLGTRYLNDHTLVRGPDARWHLYGITHESTGNPSLERAFLHATAPTLQGPWNNSLPDALTASPDYDEQVLWAPHVIEARAGIWWMYYYAGQTVANDSQVLRRAESADLSAWSRIVDAPGDRPPGGRDPMVFFDGRNWRLYSVWVDAQRHGQIVVTTSADLQTWSPMEVALEDPVAEPSLPWGNLESPFVVAYAGAFYLFVTRTGASYADYARTLVFRSNSATRFAWAPITRLQAHAAELVVERDQWYITSAGWTAYVGESNRGLSIAPLRWATEQP